jgi:Spy/CpxP family protein refolding chaperone
MRRAFLVTAVALVGSLIIPSTETLQAQTGQGAKVFEQVAQQLNLTPQQKAQIVPILMAEAPKVKAIKADTSLTRAEKLKRLKAVHDDTDPQVKAILSPQQYQQLQEIRHQEVRQAIDATIEHVDQLAEVPQSRSR